MTAWTGTQDADTFVGSTDADTLDGAGGNDTIIGNGGTDQIAGGEGNDYLVGAGAVDGGAGADTIESYAGVAYGGEGGDHITLEYGAGDVWGGAGDDVVTLGSYFTAGVLNGGEGQDTLQISGSGVLTHFTASTSGFEALDASSGLFYGGNDSLVGDSLDFGGLTVTSLHGVVMGLGAGDDTFSGSDASDAVSGGTGRDQLSGGLGNDTLDGGEDADTLRGGQGDDVLRSTDIGHDQLYGETGNDTLVGLSDTYFVDVAGDTVVEQAGGGHDVVKSGAVSYVLGANVEDLVDIGWRDFSGTGNASDNLVQGGAGHHDVLHGAGGNDTVVGGDLSDSLYGDGGDDVVSGGAGDDYIKSLTGEGHDVIDGGSGTDLLTLERSDETHALHVDLTLAGVQHVGDVGAGSTDSSFTSIEQIRFAGGAGDDDARGGGLDDVLKGGSGSDTLVGGAGADVLQGGAGHDLLTGGAGADTFRFDGPAASAYDEVNDFSHADGDHIALSATGFGIASLSDVDILFGNVAPISAHATLVYNAGVGDLYFDADGTGAGARALVAHLDGHPDLTAGDFTLF